MIEIRHGLPDALREEAAALYLEAFWGKLEHVVFHRKQKTLPLPSAERIFCCLTESDKRNTL